MTEETVFSGTHLRAALWRAGPEGGGLVVTFDHRDPTRTGFPPFRPSLQLAEKGLSQLAVHTAANDWFVNAETPALSGAMARVCAGFCHVTLLGWSMGGYGALRYARAAGAARVIAISPQVSLDPALVPFERRYPAEAARFDPVLGDLALHAMPGLRGIVAFDPFVRPDLAHARRIGALFPGLSIARLGFGGHPATLVLREAGRQALPLRLAIRREGAEVLIAAHRAARRAAAGYWQRLARRAGERRPRLAELAQQRAAALAVGRG